MANPTEISKKTNLLELCSTSIDGSEPRQNHSDFSSLDLKALSLTVRFTGWRNLDINFKSWATKMAISYKPIWRKAGILEAVMASTNTIPKDTDLVFSVAEKWCPKTNTFVFPWGETTITLEDVMVLLGFSVLGSPVFAGLDSEEEKIEANLVKELRKIAKDVKGSYHVSQVAWMKRFMGCGDELEHVAFLVLWLCYFVFPLRYSRIYRSVFPIAVHLSRGTSIALAPAVLAHLYADLSILKIHITAFAISKDIERISNLTGLFKLVQVWTWERFRKLQPLPNKLMKGEARLALWHDLEHRTTRVRQVLDSSKLDSFEWRPYTKTVKNWEFPKFYPERAMFVPVDPNLDDEFLSFARCFKVSQLVGIDCVEHYFPNRVALQFGMHQDALGPVNKNKLSQQAAWSDYSKPIDDLTLYIPSRSAVPCDYPMFSDWWRKPLPKLASTRADEDEMIRPPEKEQRNEGSGEPGNKAGNSIAMSLIDKNHSSDPPLGFNEAISIVVSQPEKRQIIEDELDVCGRNAEKMNDVRKKQECLIPKDSAIIAGENSSSSENNTVYVDKLIDDGSKEQECLLSEDNAIVVEKASSDEKENDAVVDDILIQKKVAIEELGLKAHNNEPTPRQKLANGDETSKADKSKIVVGGETQGHDYLIHDIARTTEETSKTNEQLDDLEKRNEDVSDHSYNKSLLKLKRLESKMDELFVNAERNLAWWKEERVIRHV